MVADNENAIENNSEYGDSDTEVDEEVVYVYSL